MTDTDEDLAPSLANQYVEKQDTIKAIEADCVVIKDRLSQLLPYTVDGPKMWTFPETRAEWTKGRHTEKVDTGKLRVALVLAGVDEETLKKAFEQATVATDGAPSMRISRVKP